MTIGSIPWWLALVTALWFGLMARRSGRNWILWVVSGAVFGLVTATLILGLGRAMAIPLSDHARSVAQTKWTVAVIIVVAVVGWLLTLGLHRQHAPQPPVPTSSPMESKAVK